MRTLLVNLNAEMMDLLAGFSYVELSRRPGAGNVVRLRGVKAESEKTSKLYPKGNNRKNASFVVSGKYAHSIGMEHGVRYRLESPTASAKDHATDDTTPYFVARKLGEIPKAGEPGRKERLDFPVMTVTERIKLTKAQRVAKAQEREAAKATAKPPAAKKQQVWSPDDVTKAAASEKTAPAVKAAPAVKDATPAPAGRPLVMYLTRDTLSLFEGFDRVQIFKRISGNNRGTLALRGTTLEQPNNNNSGVYPIQQQGSTRILVIPADDVAKLGLPTTGVRYGLPLSAQKPDETGGTIYNLKALTEQPPAGTPMATLAPRGVAVPRLPQAEAPTKAETKPAAKAAPEAPVEAPTKTPAAPLVEAAPEPVVASEAAPAPLPATEPPATEPVDAAPADAVPAEPVVPPSDIVGVVNSMLTTMQTAIQMVTETQQRNAESQQRNTENLTKVLAGFQESTSRLIRVMETTGMATVSHERRLAVVEQRLAAVQHGDDPRPATAVKPAVAAKAEETHRH